MTWSERSVLVDLLAQMKTAAAELRSRHVTRLVQDNRRCSVRAETVLFELQSYDILARATNFRFSESSTSFWKFRIRKESDMHSGSRSYSNRSKHFVYPGVTFENEIWVHMFCRSHVPRPLNSDNSAGRCDRARFYQSMFQCPELNGEEETLIVLYTPALTREVPQKGLRLRGTNLI